MKHYKITPKDLEYSSFKKFVQNYNINWCNLLHPTSFMPWNKWCEYEGNTDEIEHTYYHIARSGQYSIENAKKLINYKPKYTTRETVEIAIQSYIERGIINVSRQ